MMHEPDITKYLIETVFYYSDILDRGPLFEVISFTTDKSSFYFGAKLAPNLITDSN